MSLIPRRIPFHVLLLLVTLASSLAATSCKWTRNLFAEKGPPFDPCDPYYDYYENDKHFIHDRMIREDGTIDYRRIFKGLDPEYTRCDPLGDHRSMKKPPDSGTPPSGEPANPPKGE